MKIAVLSDTHGFLRSQVKEIIGQCDAVLHAGDIDEPAIMDEIRDAARPGALVYFVRGNNDWGKWARALPVRADFTLGGMKFSMIHNRRDLPPDPGDRQIIIFGHSHQYTEEVREGRLWLNPGSCGPRRFRQEITMAVLIIEKGSWQAVRMELSCE